MLKVLFLNSVREDMWGGGEKWMVAAGAGLKERGHSVYLGGRRGSCFLNEGAKKGLGTVSFSFRGDLDPIASLAILRFLKKESITTICTNYDKELRLAMFPVGLLGGRTLVARKGLALIRDRAVYRFTYKKFVDAIIVPSDSLKSELSEIPWLDPGLIHVVPNGVDASRYKPSDDKSFLKEIGVAPGTPAAGVVARLSAQKGHDVFLRAACAVRQELPDAKFIIIGEGRERQAIEKMAENLSLRESVVFAGHRWDMPGVYGALDVVVLPSFYEGLPNAVLEAMSCGKAIVATRAGGTGEAVADEVSGFLVEPGDAESMAARIVRLLRDPALRERMGIAGRHLVTEKFTTDRMVESVESLFVSLMP